MIEKRGLYLNREAWGQCFRCIFCCTYAMQMKAWTHHHSNGTFCILPPDVRMQVHNDSISLMTTVHAGQQFNIIVIYCGAFEVTGYIWEHIIHYFLTNTMQSIASITCYDYTCMILGCDEIWKNRDRTITSISLFTI